MVYIGMPVKEWGAHERIIEVLILLLVIFTALSYIGNHKKISLFGIVYLLKTGL